MQKLILYACVILIINSIFHILTPNGSIKGIMGFVLNLFLIGLILAPIVKSTSFSTINNYFNSNLKNLTNDEQIKQKIFNNNKKSLEYAIKILLKNEGFKNCNVEIETNGEKKETKIYIKIDSTEKQNETKIKNLIKKETGINPIIIFKWNNLKITKNLAKNSYNDLTISIEIKYKQKKFKLKKLKGDHISWNSKKKLKFGYHPNQTKQNS